MQIKENIKKYWVDGELGFDSNGYQVVKLVLESFRVFKLNIGSINRYNSIGMSGHCEKLSCKIKFIVTL
jgi:hypothetical protein